MTTGLRWRIIALQIILVLVLAFGAAFLFYESNFVNGQIHDQLAAQKITFPEANSPAINALPPNDAAAMKQYAGQQLTTGQQAQVYANNFIGVHLNDVAGGRTYAEVSAASLLAPNNPILKAQATTLFQGETLRGLLLNAYGWSEAAKFMFWGAIGLVIAAVAVLGTLAYEVLDLVRSRETAPSREVRSGRPATPGS